MMLKKFRVSIVITVLYLCLSIGLHVWTLSLRWLLNFYFLPLYCGYLYSIYLL